MNLREFINYRTHCLTCHSELKLSFHSKKRQKHKLFFDRLLVQMDLSSFKKNQKSYKVGYSIDYDTNDFCIEFFDNDGAHYSTREIPLFLLKRFKTLDKNHGKYSIIKHCTSCQKYWYSSNSFDLDYKIANLGDLSIHSEHGAFFKSFNDGYKIYRLYSYYDKNESSFDVAKESVDVLRYKGVDNTVGQNYIKTHIIPFKQSPNVIIEKLDRLILFS